MKVRDSSNLHSPYAKALLSRPKPQRSRSRRKSCLPPTKPAADEEDEEESYFLADECPSTPMGYDSDVEASRGSSRGSADDFEDMLTNHLDTRDRYGRGCRHSSGSRSSSPHRQLTQREQQQALTVARRAEAGLADGAPANVPRPKQPARRAPPPPPPPPKTPKATKSPEQPPSEEAGVRAEAAWVDEDRWLSTHQDGPGDGDDGGGDSGDDVAVEPRDAAAAAEDTSWSLVDLAAAGRAVPESREEREQQQSEKLQWRKALAAASVAATRAGDAMRAAAAAARDGAWVGRSLCLLWLWLCSLWGVGGPFPAA
jgi:hypothetical protein